MESLSKWGDQDETHSSGRELLTQTQIDVLKKHPGLGGIAAWRSGAIRRLLTDGHLIRKDLEAERLAEITTPEFPGERLVACSNPQLAEQRRPKRRSCWRPRRPSWGRWPPAWRGRRVRPRRRPRAA